MRCLSTSGAWFQPVNGIPFPFRDGMRGRAKLLDERKLQRVASYSDVGIEVISATQRLESLVNCLVKQRFLNEEPLLLPITL
jgi:hypothetical protein